jgi:aspartate/methionine/tyrosine aminotransferase
MLTLKNINPRVLAAEYAVRGPILQRALELEAQGRKIIYCNIGNPLAFKQQPLSYLRQALSLLENPALLANDSIVASYPKDIVARVREILKMHPQGTGAYTQSAGIPFIRKAVADFIARRDGIPADMDHILLTDGASKGAQAVLLALLAAPGDGVMIPIPQYPLYSASLAIYGGEQIGYFLDEENSWQLNQTILATSFEGAVAKDIQPKGIVVINPSNPTGSVLSRENVEMIVRFARSHSLSLIADEVYQENMYDRALHFHSFARVMADMKETDVSLFSLHSVSKGYLGECGHRGGYLELRNVPEDVFAEFIKMQSISLCSNASGQFTTYLMVAPPQPGDESYETFIRERDAILADLAAKAEILGKGVNTIPGMSVVIPRGAMYAFVRFSLPKEKGIDVESMPEDRRREYEAVRDSDYCLALLEQTGICVVPGSGFGQRAGTFHFRTTFLPPRDEVESLVEKLRAFHNSYVRALEKA